MGLQAEDLKCRTERLWLRNSLFTWLLNRLLTRFRCVLWFCFRAIWPQARKERKEKVSAISVDRVGGSTGIGEGADKGMATHACWHQQQWQALGGPVTRVSLVIQDTSFCLQRRFIARNKRSKGPKWWLPQSSQGPAGGAQVRTLSSSRTISRELRWWMFSQSRLGRVRETLFDGHLCYSMWLFPMKDNL